MNGKLFALTQTEVDSLIGNVRALSAHLNEMHEKLHAVETSKAMAVDAVLYEPMRKFLKIKFDLALDGTKESQDAEIKKFMERKDVRILQEFYDYLKTLQKT